MNILSFQIFLIKVPFVLQYSHQNTQWAEMARLRLQYNEARQRMTGLQNDLASLEDQIIPGQTESDKDRYEKHKMHAQTLRCKI